MPSVGEQLGELAALRQSGALTEAEFSAAKQRVLSAGAASPVVAIATIVEALPVFDGGGAVAVEPVSAKAYSSLPPPPAPMAPVMATAQATAAPVHSIYPVLAPTAPITAHATPMIPFDGVEAARDATASQRNVLVNRSGAIVPRSSTSLLNIQRTEHGLIVTSPLNENRNGIVRFACREQPTFVSRKLALRTNPPQFCPPFRRLPPPHARPCTRPCAPQFGQLLVGLMVIGLAIGMGVFMNLYLWSREFLVMHAHPRRIAPPKCVRAVAHHLHPLHSRHHSRTPPLCPAILICVHRSWDLCWPETQFVEPHALSNGVSYFSCSGDAIPDPCHTDDDDIFPHRVYVH